jgi:hypothetical protein
VERDQQPSRSEGKFWCKIFQTKHDIVGALCDDDLLDKRLRHGGMEVKVSKDFYGGAVVDEKAAVNIMRKVTVGNVIGERIVGVAKKNGFITDENVISIDGVPHAQFVKV